MRYLRLALVAYLVVAAACAEDGGLRPPHVLYEPTPMDVVEAMLVLGEVSATDLVADIGCGDGRIVIEAVRRYGARGLCIDIDPQRIEEATENARKAGVLERIRFVQQDMFAVDLRGVTVVMLFLSRQHNQQLRPKLGRELGSGARVVSHWHDMGDWKPSRTLRVKSGGRERPVYLWIMGTEPELPR